MAFRLCSMCDEAIDYRKMYIEAQLKIGELERHIDKINFTDSSQKLLKEEMTNNITLLEKPNTSPLPKTNEIWKMVTITFDPRKFPNLFVRQSQREYIKQSLEELIITDYGCNYHLADFYGCYELHESGVVHAHLMISHIHIEELNILKMSFTDNKNNLYAIHCCDKSFDDVLAYINKSETKDKHNQTNYFLYRKCDKTGVDLRRTIKKRQKAKKLPEFMGEINWLDL